MATPPKTIREYQLLVKNLEDRIDALETDRNILTNTVKNLMPIHTLEPAKNDAMTTLELALTEYSTSYPAWSDYEFLEMPHKMSEALEILESIK